MDSQKRQTMMFSKHLSQAELPTSQGAARPRHLQPSHRPSTPIVPRNTEPKEQLDGIYSGNPWERYRRIVKILDFYDDVDVAVSCSDESKLFHVRKFSLASNREILKRQYKHKNIVSILEIFNDKTYIYTILEEMELPLHCLYECPAFPSLKQLAATIAQIMDGLCFLKDHQLGHGRLIDLQNGKHICNSVLVSRNGVVKLTNQELFTDYKSARNKDIAALNRIALLLSQKDAGPNISSENKVPQFLSFIANTSSSASLTSLRQDPVLNKWDHSALVSLVYQANMSVQRFYSFPADNR